MIFSKKGLGPVVAVALFMVITVISVVAFQNWFLDYNTSIFVNSEEYSNSIKNDFGSEALIGDTLYIKAPLNEPLIVNSVQVDGADCSISGNYSNITAVSIDSCLNATSNRKVEVVVNTNLGVISNDVYYKVSDFSGIYTYSWSLLHVLDNPNNYSVATSDNFGISVNIDDNYAIIAANEGDSGGVNSGKVYIFNLTNGSLLSVLDNPNNYSTSANDYFGNSLSISGEYVLVGAYYEDDAGGTASGKAYIFNVTDGSLLHVLDNPNNYSTSEWDGFGISVAASSDYALVSSDYEEDGSGKVYVFNITTGSLLYTLHNPNNYSTGDWDFFGYSISMDGDYVLVGAYNEDDTNGTDSGKAYIFNVSDGGSLLYVLDNPNNYSTSENDYFGASVSIDGNYALVGAYLEGDSGGVESGKAYVFNVSDGSLLYVLDNPNNYSTSEYDRFGYTVSINADYVLVGTYFEDDADGSQSGKAYIFNVTDGSLVHVFDNPNYYSTSTNDGFGRSLAVRGNYAIFGASSEDEPSMGNSGKAYIFSWS